MEVVSSLDSVVLGESQILGQVRDSYLHAKRKGTLQSPQSSL